MDRLAPFVRLWIVVLLLCHSGFAHAQELEAIPTPDELQAADRDDRPVVRIETPATGERVTIPFTVSGTAPHGARLELWVGDSLERVFQSDASGRFTTPVSRAGESGAKVWIHQVGGRGKRVQSASVEVIWGGAAPAKEADGSAAHPTDPTEPSAPAETTKPAQKEAVPVSDDPILKTDPVDLSELDAAPVPPPVDQALAGAARPAEAAPVEEASEETDESGETAAETYQTSTYAYQRPPPNRVLRGTVEGLTGGVAGFLGATLGLALGFSAGAILTGDPFVGLFVGGLGALLGYAISVPIAVIVVGNLMDGNGAIWATVVGEIVGLIAGGAIAALTAPTLGDSPIPGLAVFTLPVAGAVLGYELTSDPSARAAKNPVPRAHLGPVIIPRRDGRAAAGLGLSVRF